MSIRHLFMLLFLCISKCHSAEEQVAILMPYAEPLQRDTYLCTSIPVPREETQYIVKVSRIETRGPATHAILYGCGAPGHQSTDQLNAVWVCGQDPNSGPDGLPVAPFCAPKQKLEFMFESNTGAPDMKLPAGIGFKVGGYTGIDYLVLGVHYQVGEYLKSNGNISTATDRKPGMILTIEPASTAHVMKRAGLLMLVSYGVIEPFSITHLEVAHRIDQHIVLHPFAFQVYTKKLGKFVTGWKAGSDGTWTLIGSHDPQGKEQYYPVINSNLTISEGDVIAARCTMNNTLSYSVSADPPAYDEMCSFQLLYYVDGDELLGDGKSIKSPGPPEYFWHTDPTVPKVPPEVDLAASLSG